MDEQALQHTFKKLFYLFDLYLVILKVVEMFHGISRLTDQTLEGKKDCRFFWRCPRVPFFFFVPNLLRKAVKVTQGRIVRTEHGPENH